MSLRTESSLLASDMKEVDTGDAIRLEGVSVRYTVPQERISSFKEYAIRRLHGQSAYREVLALKGVNLAIRRGEVFGIIGSNGAGKSTLLKVIARVIRPTEGRVRVEGKVAPLLEFGAGFHPELSGRENLFLNGALLGFSRREMQEKLERIVDFAELWDFIDVPIRAYSSGMVARLGFAIATDVEPDVLLVDELLAVGDEKFQHKSAARMETFQRKGATIVLVTHSMDTVKSMCRRSVWLEQGSVRAIGSSEQIVEDYQRAASISR